MEKARLSFWWGSELHLKIVAAALCHYNKSHEVVVTCFSSHVNHVRNSRHKSSHVQYFRDVSFKFTGTGFQDMYLQCIPWIFPVYQAIFYHIPSYSVICCHIDTWRMLLISQSKPPCSNSDLQDYLITSDLRISQDSSAPAAKALERSSPKFHPATEAGVARGKPPWRDSAWRCGDAAMPRLSGSRSLPSGND